MTAADGKGSDGDQIIKAHCGRCLGERNCDIRGEHFEHQSDENYQWDTRWRILQCRGCDYVFVRTVSTDYQNIHYDYGPNGETIFSAYETVRYWPAVANRNMPTWIGQLNIKGADLELRLESSLKELYGALDNDLLTLAGIGIRTSFDIASEALGVDTELPFKAKLDALVKLGDIGTADKARIEVLVDAGSASAHRGWRPNAGQLNSLMDILEHFLHQAFVLKAQSAKLDSTAGKLKALVPGKKPKASAVPITAPDGSPT